MPEIGRLVGDSSDIEHSRADVSKAQALLGYRPGVSLADGLRTLSETLKAVSASVDD